MLRRQTHFEGRRIVCIWYAWWIISCSVLALCGAQGTNCTCTARQDGEITIYTISNGPRGSGDDCEYSWASNHVLATHKGGKNIEPVKMNRIDMLVTSECFGHITYTGNCRTSEGDLHTASANCTISCRGNEQFQEVKEDSYTWIAAIVVPIILTLAIAILIVVFCLSTRLKDKMSRICSSNRLSCFYSAVTTQNPDTQEPAGVVRIV